MGDRLMQIGIEFFADRFDRLQTVFSEKILKLLEDKAHPGINRRLFAFAASGFQSELEMVDNRNQFFEQALVRIFDRIFLFASGSFLVIFKVRLSSHREVAKTVE